MYHSKEIIFKNIIVVLVIGKKSTSFPYLVVRSNYQQNDFIISADSLNNFFFQFTWMEKAQLRSFQNHLKENLKHNVKLISHI